MHQEKAPNFVSIDMQIACPEEKFRHHCRGNPTSCRRTPASIVAPYAVAMDPGVRRGEGGLGGVT
jgi:hypothetical protein